MRKLLLILALTVGLVPLAAEAQVTYKMLGGHWLDEVVRQHEKGMYLPARQVDEDGGREVLLWIQGTTEERGPDRRAARAADIVIWCYPRLYPDERHPLPKARRLAVSRSTSSGHDYLTVYPLSIIPNKVRTHLTILGER